MTRRAALYHFPAGVLCEPLCSANFMCSRSISCFYFFFFRSFIKKKKKKSLLCSCCLALQTGSEAINLFSSLWIVLLMDELRSDIELLISSPTPIPREADRWIDKWIRGWSRPKTQLLIKTPICLCTLNQTLFNIVIVTIGVCHARLQLQLFKKRCWCCHSWVCWVFHQHSVIVLSLTGTIK